MVVGTEIRGRAQAVGRQGLGRVLPHDEDRARVSARMAQEAIERRFTKALQLELAGEDAAEVAHRLPDPVGACERADQAIERPRGGPDLVRGVDRQGAGLGVAGAPVLGVDRLGQAVLHGSHPLGEQPKTSPDDQAGQTEVHGADYQAGTERAGIEERREDAIRRQPQDEAEGREHEPDQEPEPGHPDREVGEDLRGEARHRWALRDGGGGRAAAPCAARPPPHRTRWSGSVRYGRRRRPRADPAIGRGSPTLDAPPSAAVRRSRGGSGDRPRLADPGRPAVSCGSPIPRRIRRSAAARRPWTPRPQLRFADPAADPAIGRGSPSRG